MASPNRQVHWNHCSIRTRFTHRFLRALKKLTPTPPHGDSSDPKETYCKRYRNVKRAAYASMAAAVGTKRAWSRAQLLKIRRHRRTSGIIGGSGGGGGALVRRRVIIHGRNPSDQSTKELRKLVPGGEVMDLCSLLDETAHYINCLMSQVQIMRKVADLLST